MKLLVEEIVLLSFSLGSDVVSEDSLFSGESEVSVELVLDVVEVLLLLEVLLESDLLLVKHSIQFEVLEHLL